jgi:hypothetical protein
MRLPTLGLGIVSTPPLICPTCGQPATLALAAPKEEWECGNEACPEFGQVLDPEIERQQRERRPRSSEVDQPKS